MSEAPASIREQLAANRTKLSADKTTIIQLPGWDSLSTRYARLPWDKVKSLSGLGAGDSTVEVGAAMQVLIDACEEVLFKGEGLDCKYDEKLSDLVGEPEAKSPPEVLNAVFPDELSLMTHAGEYMAWAMRLREDEDKLLGKS